MKIEVRKSGEASGGCVESRTRYKSGVKVGVHTLGDFKRHDAREADKVRAVLAVVVSGSPSPPLQVEKHPNTNVAPRKKKQEASGGCVASRVR